ncbi:MAG TPA: hypothetical protein VF008_29360 [Niastella sp.]
MSCRKKAETPPDNPLQVEEITNTNDPAQPVITIPANNTLLPSRSLLNFVFDWEHAVTMPVKPGNPVVPMPWSDQAVRNYDPGLRYDFKRNDGWELVYNNFSDSAYPDNRIFILYNKFRGVLRYYCYNATPSNATVNSYQSLINEISLFTPANLNSHIFNYAGQYIIDLNSNTPEASLIEPWPISEGGWYISQFEMAYDRNMAGFAAWPQSGISWSLLFARTEELMVNNINATKKQVFLQKEGVQFTDYRGISINGNMQLQVKSVSGFDNLENVFTNPVINKIKQAVSDTVAGNLLNATLVPSLGIADCKLDVPALLRFDKKLVAFIGGLGLAMPGVDNSKVIGLGPVFNESMGVFYLASKPVIHYSRSTGAVPEQYTLDVSSVDYVINPFIQNYAVVRNFRQEIVAVDAEETKNLTEAKIFRGRVLKASAPLTILGVRVSFEVAPKNGSAPVKIVKTFKANVVNK